MQPIYTAHVAKINPIGKQLTIHPLGGRCDRAALADLAATFAHANRQAVLLCTHRANFITDIELMGELDLGIPDPSGRYVLRPQLSISGWRMHPYQLRGDGTIEPANMPTFNLPLSLRRVPAA